MDKTTTTTHSHTGTTQEAAMIYNISDVKASTVKNHDGIKVAVGLCQISVVTWERKYPSIDESPMHYSVITRLPHPEGSPMVTNEYRYEASTSIAGVKTILRSMVDYFALADNLILSQI